MASLFADSTWFPVGLGIIQGALLPPIWRLIYQQLTRKVSPDTEEGRFVAMLFLSIAAIALASAAVLLAPLYLLDLMPLRQPGSPWSWAWAGTTAVVFGGYYGMRKFRAWKNSADAARSA